VHQLSSAAKQSKTYLVETPCLCRRARLPAATFRFALLLIDAHPAGTESNFIERIVFSNGQADNYTCKTSPKTTNDLLTHSQSGGCRRNAVQHKLRYIPPQK